MLEVPSLEFLQDAHGKVVEVLEHITREAFSEHPALLRCVLDQVGAGPCSKAHVPEAARLPVVVLFLNGAQRASTA